MVILANLQCLLHEEKIHMSSQEPPFEQPREEPPSEQQPGEERGRHHDPRERSRSEFAASQTPPPGYPAPPQGYYLGPTVAPRRGCWLSSLIAFIIILFLCAGLALVGTLLGFGLGIGGIFRNSVTEPARTFSVSASPTFILTSIAGSVILKTGSTKSIVVQATKYASLGGNLNDMQITYSQSDSTVNMGTYRVGRFNFFNSTSVDFTITVPPATDLEIAMYAGSITVSGIRGKMSLLSNAGTIEVTKASLTGSSTLRTDLGRINFKGTIGTIGTYDFQSNTGSIAVTLPAMASFYANAITCGGSINTSFPLTVNHSGACTITSGDIGTAPQATLSLETNIGSISLNRD